MVTADLVFDALMLVFIITAVVCMVCSIVAWRMYGEDSVKFQGIYGVCRGVIYAEVSVPAIISIILLVWTA